MIYTGEGGNDLLHKRDQIADQKLKRNNLHLYNNNKYKVPVRVFRKVADCSGPCYMKEQSRCAYVYCGLFAVESAWEEKGKTGFKVGR